MLGESIDILTNKVLNRAKGEVATLLSYSRKKATGNTIKSLEVKDGNLLGRKGILDLVTGTSPSSAKKRHKTRKQFAQDLKPWARSKGINENSTFTIANRIFSEGDLLFRTGKDFYGQSGVDFQSVIDKNVSVLNQEAPVIINKEIRTLFDE